MRAYVKYVTIAAAACLEIVFFCLSAAGWGNLIAQKGSVMFYLKQPISIREAEEIEKKMWDEYEAGRQEGNEAEMMPEFCIWGEKEQVMLTNRNLARDTKADAILLCGNPELVFADCSQPGRKDYEGCLVDEETAWELFGSLEVVGKEISYDGNSYTIRRVIPGDKKIFAYQVNSPPKWKQEAGGMAGTETMKSDSPETGRITGGSQEKDKILNRITTKKSEETSTQELYDAWNNRYDLSMTIMDLELLQGIGGLCVLLLPISFCICVLCYLYRQFWKQRQMIWKVVVAGLMIILVLCFCLVIKSMVQIPDDYIPTRWSDFSFWSSLWREKKEALNLLLQMPKTALDSGWMADFGKITVCGILSEAVFGILGVYCFSIRYLFSPCHSVKAF